MTKKMITIIAIISLLVLGLISCACLPFFGSLPKGEHKEKICRSPNYRDGRFQNISQTPFLTEGFWKALSRPSQKNLKPKNEIPTVKTDLAALNPQENLLVWFGHSSVYVQLESK